MENVSPNLDKLAEEGIRFENAHVTIGVCQPSRQCMLTGLYPHHNGALGFDPIREDVTTLPEILRENGYYNGIIGKTKHCMPVHKFAWDYFEDTQNRKIVLEEVHIFMEKMQHNFFKMPRSWKTIFPDGKFS